MRDPGTAPSDSVGRVLVKARDAHRPRFEPALPRHLPLVKELWQQFHQRYNEPGFFARRLACMKEVGTELLRRHGLGTRFVETSPAIAVRPKVGPNAPCPCGSGRKFKKCCSRL